MALSIALAACAPPTPVVVEKEVVVEKPVVETVVVEKEVPVEVVVTPTPLPVSKLRIGIYAYMTHGIDCDAMVKRYMDAHPGVEIELLPIPGEEAAWAVITERMKLEADKGTSSWDIVIGMTPFVEPGVLAKMGVIEPLDDLIPKEIWDDLYGGVREEIVYTGDGKIYTFPWWTDVFGLIYRPSMLEEALGTREPPETWDEVLDYARKINEYYKGRIAGFGADWPWSHRMFVPILGTLTDKPFVDPGIFNLEDPAALETLKLMKELYKVMPAASAESLGCSKAFQAGGVAMETYWQPQMLRALQAGQPEWDVMMAPYPKGKRVNTVFWTAGAIIPKHSANKEEAVRFMLEGLLDWATVVDSTIGDYKIVPFKSLNEKLEKWGMMPSWAPPLLETLEVAKPIPCNPYFLSIEQPIFKEEIEKMMYKDVSPEETLESLKTRIMEALKEAE